MVEDPPGILNLPPMRSSVYPIQARIIGELSKYRMRRSSVSGSYLSGLKGGAAQRRPGIPASGTRGVNSVIILLLLKTDQR